MLKDFIALIYPPCCVSCNVVLHPHEKHICLACFMKLPKTMFHTQVNNPVERVFWGKVPIKAATSHLFFTKNTPTQSLLHTLKYQNQPEIGFYLGSMLGEEITKSNRFNHVDCIVPVPLHKRKLNKRGYNQCHYIANGIQSKIDKEIVENALVRSSFNKSQTKMNRFSRWLNVETIFELKASDSIENKHVLLIDDVVTTGSTLEACSKQLLKGNPASISIATVAYSA